MDYLEAKINQLVIEKPGRQKTFVRTFATKPIRPLAGKLGKVFGLIEIESTHPQIPKLIDLIIEEIKNHYYGQDNLTQGEDFPLISEYFESVLKKTNLSIAAFLESEQISLDLEKVNILLATCVNYEIHFTLVGNIAAILFFNTARGSYRIINILETTKSPTAFPDPLKFFSQVISGKLRPQDVLFIGTANILDYFSLERIKNILTGQKPVDGTQELNQLLSQIGNKENFGVITLELLKMAISVKAPARLEEFNYSEAASKDSMRELIHTEKETEKLLTPSFRPEVKKYFNSVKEGAQNYFSQAKSKLALPHKRPRPAILNQNFKPKINLNSQISSINNRIKNLGQIKIFTRIKGRIKNIFLPLAPLLKKLLNLVGDNFVGKKISRLAKKIFADLSTRFKKLPQKSQRLLAIIIILVTLFSLSIIFLVVKNRYDRKLQQFNQTVTDAENKKNESEASLIYRDENQARQLLIDARNLLNALNPGTKEQKDKVSRLKTEIENQLEKLRHIVYVQEPIQLVNFQNLDPGVKIANFSVLAGKNIYVQNQNNESIYKANIDSRVISTLTSPKTGNLTSGIAVAADQILFLNEAKSAFQLNPGNDAVSNSKINIGANAKIADLTTYNGKIYLLDPTGNQIYRYTRAGDNFGNPTNWITEAGVNLADAKSLTIDGTIYILKTNGEILKFDNGKTVDFKINVIDPPLAAPTKIKTSAELKYIYILDPPAKRLLVLAKDGRLISQYISQKFDDLKDFNVNEAAKTIYILNGTSIFGVPAEHLK
ncbi:MAG: hypothetical protein WCX08_05305 [Candidatus Buchananbacteria bacterium]